MSRVTKPQWQIQGKGARVIKVIGRQNKQLPRLDPFMMLDYFHAKLPAGFPDHPHRGFETVTYMIKGYNHHEDFKGHKGTIGPGDVQWMTAGKGIVHAEMPASDQQDSVGFQLWVNLTKDLKMIAPQYQQFTKNQMPVVEKEGASITIISGKYEGVEGPINHRTPAYFYDVSIQKKGNFSIPLLSNWNSFVFVFEGSVTYQNTTKIQTNECLILETNQKEDIANHQFSSEEGARFLLIGGKPLKEPCVQRGPYAMNTEEELQQAIIDYKEGKNGFQGSKQWKSKIREMANGKKLQEL